MSLVLPLLVTVGGAIPKSKNGVTYQVIQMNVTVSLNTACTLYGSCSKVPEAATISNNAQGFLQFQADSSLEKALVDMRFDFLSTPPEGRTYLDFPAMTCDTQPENNDLWGYTDVTKCQCKTCTESCTSDGIKVVFPGFFHGFEYKLVAIAYGVIIAAIIIIYAISTIIARRQKKNKSSNGSSVKEELQYIAPRKDSD
jgi:hypothetical protein